MTWFIAGSLQPLCFCLVFILLILFLLLLSFVVSFVHHIIYNFCFISQYLCLCCLSFANTCYHSNVIERKREWTQKKLCVFLLLFIWTVDWNRSFWRYHIAHMNLQSMFVFIILNFVLTAFFSSSFDYSFFSVVLHEYFNLTEANRKNWIIFLCRWQSIFPHMICEKKCVCGR